MMYLLCKCGVKINPDELNLKDCPVCEDFINKISLNKKLEEKREKKRQYFKNYLATHHEYFKIKQRESRQRKKGLDTGFGCDKIELVNNR